MPNSYPFTSLHNAPLQVDCVYEGGPSPNLAGDPISKLIPGIGNAGGFRWAKRRDGSGLPAFIVLYTSLREIEWPDYLDRETGIFRYYGDNRSAGHDIREKRGNRMLEMLFDMLNSKRWKDIPPILVFSRAYEVGRDIRFLGLVAPGNPALSPDRDLVAFWRTIGENRFQNYEAYFTVLDCGSELITRDWLNSLIYDHETALKEAPQAWRSFMEKGRDGINALRSPRIIQIPKRDEQLQCDAEGELCVNGIHDFFEARGDFTGFEACAADIVMRMDPHFEHFELTRPWRDGGRDALGIYKMGTGLPGNIPLKVDCALEAKCYQTNHAVGVREMSRLISRIRYRQFGIMVTTSAVDTQAYEEVVCDGHPILIVTRHDIAGILKRSGIGPQNLLPWLSNVEARFQRLP